MFFCSTKLDAVTCTSLCCLLGVGWGSLFIILVSVTRGIVVLFFVRIGAVLARNAAFRTFSSYCVLFCGLNISVVECRQSGCSYTGADKFLARPSGIPRNFVRGVQQIQLRTEGRENGDLGAVAP